MKRFILNRVLIFAFVFFVAGNFIAFGQTSVTSQRHGNWSTFGTDGVWPGAVPTGNINVNLNHRVVYDAEPSTGISLTIPNSVITNSGNTTQTFSRYLNLGPSLYTFESLTIPTVYGDLTLNTGSSQVDVTPIPQSPNLLNGSTFGMQAGSLIQISNSTQVISTKPSAPQLPSGYFNPLVGRQTNIFPSTFFTLTNATGTSSQGVGPNFYTISPASYSTSIFLDPQDDNYYTLIANTTSYSSNQRTLTLGNGITNFEGGAYIINGGLILNNNSTLVLGPLECRVCDTFDVLYDQTACNVANANGKCNKTQLYLEGDSQFRVGTSSRVIVYGNVLNNLDVTNNCNNNSACIDLDGGLYVVGNYEGGTNARIEGSGDVYTKGSIKTANNGISSSLFGVSGIVCLADCQATQETCTGFSTSVSPSGFLAFCPNNTAISAFFTPSANTNTAPTVIWRGSPDGTTWTANGNPDPYIITNGNSIPNNTSQTYKVQAFSSATYQANSLNLVSTLTIDSSLPPGGDNPYYYRCEITSGGCTEISNIVIVTRTISAVKIWKGGTNTTIINSSNVTGTSPFSWFNPNNWCGGSSNSYPSIDETVLIEDVPSFSVNGAVTKYFPEIDPSKFPYPTNITQASAKEILIKAGAKFTNNGVLALNGDFENYGTHSSSSPGKLAFLNPGTSTNRFIRTSSTSNSTSQFHSIEVQPNVVLNMPNSSDGGVKISGNLDVQGSLVRSGNSATTTILNGSSQTLTASPTSIVDFHDLTMGIQTTQNVIMQGGNFNLYGKLSFLNPATSQNLSISSGASLTVKSISAISEQNGSIGNLNSTGGISGTVKVERFIPSTYGVNFRYFTSPVSSPTPIGFDYVGSPSASSVSSLLGERYTWITSTDNSGSGSWAQTGDFKPGKGYAVYYNPGTGTGNTWTVSGRVNQKDIHLLCDANTSSSDSNCEKSYKGWHLIGNPYPHPIYWSSFWNSTLASDARIIQVPYSTKNGTTLNPCLGCSTGGGFYGEFKDPSNNNRLTDRALGAGIGRVIAIRDPDNQRLRYSVLGNQPGYDFETYWFPPKALSPYQDANTFNFNGNIDVGQAFWIYSYGLTFDANIVPKYPDVSATNYDAELIITEDAKNLPINTTTPFFSRSEPDLNANYRIAIQIKNDLTGDFAFHSFKGLKKSIPRIVPPLPKLWNMDVNIFMMGSDGEPIISSDSDGLSNSEIIRLGYSVAEPGEYEIDFEVTDNFLDGESLYLIDEYEGTITPVNKESVYSFTAGSAGKEVKDRFYLTKDPLKVIPIQQLDIFPNPAKDLLNVRVSGIPEQVRLTIYDMEGKQITESEFFRETSLDISNWRSGMYIVQVKSNKGLSVKKFIKTK